MNQPMPDDKLRLFVSGGGPAGLTCAYEYLKIAPGTGVVVAEANEIVGGISRTENRDGFRVDIGGHRFFTKVTEVERMWHEVLGPDMIRVPRLSRIYYRDRYFHYPLKIFNALSNIGIYESIRIVLSYLKWRVRPHRKEESFEEWVINRFGGRLYMHFFRSYTQKVWGIPPKEIRADWAAQRIKNLSLSKAVWNALWGANDTSSLIDEFSYPRLGPGMMWERTAEIIHESGGQVLTKTTVERFVRRGNRIEAALVRDSNGLHRVEADHFVSSLDLQALVGAMDPPPPAAVREAAEKLSYRDFLIVALVLDSPDPFPDNWIYIHSSDVKVGRIQNFRAWSKEMVPNDRQSSIGMEYFCQEGDGLWTMSDEELGKLAARELENLRLARESDVDHSFVVRQPKAYPVYNTEYKDAVDTIAAWVNSLENFQTIGRNGLHRYNNQDHSMLTAMLAARNIEGEDNDLWTVNVERSYHEEFERKEVPNAPDIQTADGGRDMQSSRSDGHPAYGNVAPLFSFRGLLWAFVFANFLCWPIYLSVGALVSPDTSGYLNAGSAIWSMIATAAGITEVAVVAAPNDIVSAGGDEIASRLASNSDGTPRFGRSLVYSPLAYAAVAIGGAITLALAQTTLVIFSFFALVGASAVAAPKTLISGFAALAIGSTLPWHSVYLMPDVLAAIPIIFGAALLGPFELMNRAQKITISVITAGATGAHYGYLPLTATICAFAILILLWQRRMSLAILMAAAFATLTPLSINVAASWIALDRPSAMPLRLPILLARSIQDGPAAWYLEQACPEADFAMCEAFKDEMPKSIRQFLWDQNGVASLDREEMQKIRDQEARLLVEVFKAYPLEQTYFFVRNSVRQLARVGTGELNIQTSANDIGFSEQTAIVDPDGLLALFDYITPIVTFLAALSLGGLLVTGQLNSMQGRVLAGVVLGVLVNAAIFGGLSAPVDRYQSRLIWLVPALLAVILATRVSKVASQKSASNLHRRHVNVS